MIYIFILSFIGIISGQNNCCIGLEGWYNSANSSSMCLPSNPGYYVSDSCGFPAVCPTGTFCPNEGNVLPTPCSPGFYCPQIQGVQQFPCLPGYYCPISSLIIGEPCKAGNYCPYSQMINQFVCPKGTFCQGGNANYQLCPIGYYCPFEGMNTFYNCPIGNYCPFEGMSQPLPCPSGYYCPNKMTIQPIVCPIGHYCSTGLSLPNPCPLGNICPYSNLSFPIPCSIGNYCPNSTMIQSIICPKGNYCNVAGLVNPIPCPIGTYNNNTGARDISDCTICKIGVPVGTVCDKVGLSKPELCPTGKFCPISGITSEIDCPMGSYNSKQGSISENDCIKCPAGYYCRKKGMSIPTICPIGYYCQTGYIIPSACPTGTYNGNTGIENITGCNKCPAGKFNANIGQTTINNCFSCPSGTFCQEGSSSPIPCPSNFYCPDTLTKIPCKKGTYYSGVQGISENVCSPCPKGYVCLGNGMGKEQCPIGTYSSDEGSYDCTICPAGHYCELGTSIPIKCSENTIAIKGSGGCTACLEGQYTDELKIKCYECETSKFNFNSWWCMTFFERIVFIGVWLGSGISLFLSIYKIRIFILTRLKKLRKNGLKFTLKRFIFLEKVLNNNRDLSYFDFDSKKKFMVKNGDEIKELHELIISMQKEIEVLKM